MLSFQNLRVPLSILELHAPHRGQFVVGATGHLAAHLDRTAHRFRLFGTDFPHHSGTLARIAERIDQCFDYFGAIFRLTLREKSVLDRAAE